MAHLRLGGHFRRFVLAAKSRFPETETAEGRDSDFRNAVLTAKEGRASVLARPFEPRNTIPFES